MNESNRLRSLHQILNNAILDGIPEENAGYVLLDAMRLERKPYNFMAFYELFSKAKDDALSLMTIENGIYKEEYTVQINAITKLQDFFISNNAFAQVWKTFLDEIERGHYMGILSPLAREFRKHNPKIFLEKDFLERFNIDLTKLINEVLESELSPDLKKYIINKIEDLTQSIRRYLIDGTDGLEKIVKSVMCDLTLSEYNLTDRDKKNSKYKKFRSIAFAMLHFCTPTLWDITGFVPDYQQFWKPTYEEFIKGQEEIERISEKHTNILEIIRDSEIQKICIYKKEIKQIEGSEEQKVLEGSKEQKVLEGSKENTVDGRVGNFDAKKSKK
jgi:hypothetical protein